ncbi:MAG TPA: photosystem I reaction center subunit PsaK [Thermosynechococcaceae cyanobacterium]
MFTTTLLAAVATAAPRAVQWSPAVGLIMLVANLAAIAFGRATIQRPNDGPQLPIPIGLSIPALLATTSFGHIIGAVVILGLSNIGAL